MKRNPRPPDRRNVELVSRRKTHIRMYYAQERRGWERKGRRATGLSAPETEVAGRGHTEMGWCTHTRRGRNGTRRDGTGWDGRGMTVAG